MKKLIFLAFASMFLVACGDSSDSSGVSSNIPTDPNQLFSTSKFLSRDVGIVYTTQLTGNGSNAINYSGSYSIVNTAQTTLGGVLVTPRSSIISFNGGGKSITVTSTSYINNSGSLVAVLLTEKICTAISLDVIPASIKIGDFATLSQLTCSDSTTIERNWRAEDAFNGKIKIVTNNITKNSSSVITATSYTNVTLDSNGDIVAYSGKATEVTGSSNFTLTFRSI